MATVINKSRGYKGQSFVGVQRLTVPKQSMSLKEVLRRFVRREQLPVLKDGVYEHRFGDLEKIAKMDIVDQMEQVAKWKADIAAFEKRAKEKAQADKVAAEKKREEEIEAAAIAKVQASSKQPAVRTPEEIR